MNPDLIQRALITRIERLESEAGRRDIEVLAASAAWTVLWKLIFPDAPPCDIDATGIHYITEELKRRGLTSGKAGE